MVVSNIISNYKILIDFKYILNVLLDKKLFENKHRFIKEYNITDYLHIELMSVTNEVLKFSVYNNYSRVYIYLDRHIKGIGESMINVILTERHLLENDLKTINERLHVVSSYGTQVNGPQVRFSGVRNKNLEEMFKAKGFDASGDKNVTNNTNILIVPYQNYMSGKVAKALRVPGCVIMTEQQALEWISKN